MLGSVLGVAEEKAGLSSSEFPTSAGIDSSVGSSFHYIMQNCMYVSN